MTKPALAVVAQPDPHPSPARQRMAALLTRLRETRAEQDRAAAAKDVATRATTAGRGLGDTIANRIEAWARGQGDAPDLSGLRETYAASVRASDQMPALDTALQRATEMYRITLRQIPEAVAAILLEDAELELAALIEADRAALARRARVNGLFRFLERAVTQKSMPELLRPAEAFRKRIPPAPEVSLVAVQTEMGKWGELFDRLAGDPGARRE